MGMFYRSQQGAVQGPSSGKTVTALRNPRIVCEQTVLKKETRLCTAPFGFDMRMYIT